jgi:MOSC domain-containing protein YiiM
VTVLGLEELREGLGHILGSPRDEGRLELVVRRPAENEREVVTEARIEPGRGVVGDSWSSRPRPNPDAEVTLMNVRCIALLAGDVDRWPLAGDQLFVDLDLSLANLPPGTRLRIGEALLEASSKPHTGCSKFSSRFGDEALRFVSSREGRAARLRGMNALVVEGGTVRVGDAVVKLGAAEDRV